MSSMRRQGHYADSSMNVEGNAQMHHGPGQRMQHSSRMNHFSGRAESLHSDDEYLPSKPEGQWRWERDDQTGTVISSSHGFREGMFQGQRPDSKMNSDEKVNAGARPQAHELDGEIGYEDGSVPQTWEGLERKFLEDIMKLTAEHDSAEDAEISRHRERLNEINTKYQEKLSSVRARQAALRDDFLRKEQQIRHQQYQQQAHLISYQQAAAVADGGAGDPHAFGPTSTAAASGAYGGGQFGFYRERQQFGVGGSGDSGGGSSGGGRGRGRSSRGRGFEPRPSYHDSRAYGSGARYY